VLALVQAHSWSQVVHVLASSFNTVTYILVSREQDAPRLCVCEQIDDC